MYNKINVNIYIRIMHKLAFDYDPKGLYRKLFVIDAGYLQLNRERSFIAGRTDP